MISTGYRPDIDGLRAISVLAVIVFHATRRLPGGFVGVDVFFVISGFLITGLIAADLDRGTFSLLDFWSRRIRRIWPAAVLVTLAVLGVGYFVMLPTDYVATAKDARAQAAMLANVQFWHSLSDDYFAPAMEQRPLLHMWSLALEEQFYLSTHAKAVFYLLPFRAWRCPADHHRQWWRNTHEPAAGTPAARDNQTHVLLTLPLALAAVGISKVCRGAVTICVLEGGRARCGRDPLLHNVAVGGVAVSHSICRDRTGRPWRMENRVLGAGRQWRRAVTGSCDRSVRRTTRSIHRGRTLLWGGSSRHNLLARRYPARRRYLSSAARGHRKPVWNLLLALGRQSCTLRGGHTR